MTQLITPPQSSTYRHVLPPSPPSQSPLTVLLPCSPSQSSPDRRVLPPAQPGGLLRPPVARQPGGSRGGGTALFTDWPGREGKRFSEHGGGLYDRES